MIIEKHINNNSIKPFNFLAFECYSLLNKFTLLSKKINFSSLPHPAALSANPGKWNFLFKQTNAQLLSNFFGCWSGGWVESAKLIEQINTRCGANFPQVGCCEPLPLNEKNSVY